MAERRLGWIAAAGVLLAATPGFAHEGPPYPIVVDRDAGPVRMSVWTDPDVGEGTFFVFLEPRAGIPMPERCTVDVVVRPIDGREPESRHRAEPRRARRGALQFVATVPFARAETCSVRVVLASAGGAGEARARVVVTPPGNGPWIDFALYLFPFAAVAFLFVKAVHRGRRR